MAFTAKDVQKLREQTGAGMMDCKKALTSSDGDFEKAIEFLREKGLAAAAKKAGRIAAEGAVIDADAVGDGLAVRRRGADDKLRLVKPEQRRVRVLRRNLAQHLDAAENGFQRLRRVRRNGERGVVGLLPQTLAVFFEHDALAAVGIVDFCQLAVDLQKLRLRRPAVLFLRFILGDQRRDEKIPADNQRQRADRQQKRHRFFHQRFLLFHQMPKPASTAAAGTTIVATTDQSLLAESLMTSGSIARLTERTVTALSFSQV